MKSVDKRKSETFNELLYYFNKASNNINQVAKRIHQEALKETGELKQEILNAILASLNRLNENFRTGNNKKLTYSHAYDLKFLSSTEPHISYIHL